MATLEEVVKEAQAAAQQATNEFVAKHGDQWGPCGFAWVDIAPANSQLARYLKQTCGAEKNYGRPGVHVWNPSGHSTQSIDAKEAGARAFADVLKKHFPEHRIYANSRLD